MITTIALLLPAGVAFQVITGQALVAGLLLAENGPASVLLVPVVAGVVVTAELLADVARLDTPLRRDLTGAAASAGRAAVVAGGVFGAVMPVGGLPGPTGVLAVVVASGACVLMAARLLSDAG